MQRITQAPAPETREAPHIGCHPRSPTRSGRTSRRSATSPFDECADEQRDIYGNSRPASLRSAFLSAASAQRAPAAAAAKKRRNAATATQWPFWTALMSEPLNLAVPTPIMPPTASPLTYHQYLIPAPP